MASIYERRGKFCVVYRWADESEKEHQKWESFKTLPEARARKTEIEYRKSCGALTVTNCSTVRELMQEYVSIYGKVTWSISVYSGNTGLIEHYINPLIGDMKLQDVTPRVLEKFYQTLLKTPAVHKATDKKHVKSSTTVQTGTIKKIHNVLRSAFKQAEKWELIDKNPALLATVPKHEAKKREIWDANTLHHAIDCCDDDRLKLCLNVAFSCSLRIGELLGLTWDCVDVSEESMMAGKPSLYVDKELQRVNKKVMRTLEQKDIIRIFPEHGPRNKTILVLKKPKTATSVRKVYLPKAVAEMLIKEKAEQNRTKEMLGDEYADYNLVICSELGTPAEGTRIRKALRELINSNELPPVVFHSLRHSSITYKLRLTGGDIKAVQGDSGHAQASMVTDQYSHILDENRVQNAQLVQEAFYEGKPIETALPKGEEDNVQRQAEDAGIDAAALIKILSNPDMVNMLKMLSKSLQT